MQTRILKPALMLILFFLLSDLSFSQVALPPHFYKKFEGTLSNNQQIQMEITVEDSLVSGNYYYKNAGKPLKISYNSRFGKDGTIYIQGYTEWNEDNDIVVKDEFRGKFINKNEISGEFTSKNNGGEKLNFKLIEKYSNGSAQVDLVNKKKVLSPCYQDECSYISITYPVLKSLNNKEAEKIINNYISTNLFQDGIEFAEEAENPHLRAEESDAVIDEFEKSFNEFVKTVREENPGEPDSTLMPLFWYNSYFMTVEFNQNNILCLSNTTSTYEGGAHPLTYIRYINFDLRTGKEILLDELFKSDYKFKLNEIGEKIFRQQFDLSGEQSLSEAGFWFENETFYLNENFSINKEGLTFNYNSYEIAPYAMGIIEVFIPFSEIKELIKENGLLVDVLK